MIITIGALYLPNTEKIHLETNICLMCIKINFIRIYIEVTAQTVHATYNKRTCLVVRHLQSICAKYPSPIPSTKYYQKIH